MSLGSGWSLMIDGRAVENVAAGNNSIAETKRNRRQSESNGTIILTIQNIQKRNSRGKFWNNKIKSDRNKLKRNCFPKNWNKCFLHQKNIIQSNILSKCSKLLF